MVLELQKKLKMSLQKIQRKPQKLGMFKTVFKFSLVEFYSVQCHSIIKNLNTR